MFGVRLRAREGEGIDLIEEQHARPRRPRLVEDRREIALALADVHVEHVADAHRDELGPALRSDRTREHRLAAARRPIEHHAAAGALLELREQPWPQERL